MKRLFSITFVVSMVLTVFLVVPTAAQTTTADCPFTPPPRLAGEAEGTVAQTYSSVRQGVGSNVILATMFAGDTFEITGDPVCSGPHYWYPITFNGISGYATEGYLNDYWLEPVDATVTTAEAQTTTTFEAQSFGTGGPTVTDAMVDPVTGVAIFEPAAGQGCPGAPTPQLTVGGEAQVNQTYSSIRPGVHSNTVSLVMVPGQTAEVLAGPVCSNLGPYNWYQVRLGNVTGWTTEGTGAAYWLVPAGA